MMMFLNSPKNPEPKQKGSIVAALDVGTSKVACFIGRVEDNHKIRVIGIGHQLSHGLRTGTVVDMEAASVAIGHAVHAAEQMAGQVVREAIVNISGGHLQSYGIESEIRLSGGQPVSDSDISRVLRHYKPLPQDNDHSTPVHVIPTQFSVDNHAGIKDPRGLHGHTLGAHLHMVTASESALRNLTSCIERRHLDIESIVASPLASALSVLVEDEMELGSVVIDMGGGTTSIAVFQNGHLAYVDCIPVGGQHVTNDIARGLITPLVHAERIKTLYGCAVASSTDERELIDVPQLGEDDVTTANHMPRSVLVSIIQPRIEEIFEMVRSRLEASGWYKTSGRRVILTGGASLMPGIRDLAQVILDKQVRQGRPMHIAGLAEMTGGPAFAATAGLLLYSQLHFENDSSVSHSFLNGNILQRMSHWLRENL